MRALQRGGTGFGLVQVRTGHQHNLVEGADGLAGGLYPQVVCQIEGPNSIIESGGAEVGCTRGVSQGMRVDGGLWSIIVDICGEGCLLGILVASTSLLATMSSVASLSLDRSISTCTTVGPALLLLLGKLGVSQLALHSTKLVGLGALTASTGRGAFLLKGERGSLDYPIRLEVLDLVERRLAKNLSYDLHSGRELAKDDHCLHGGRELEAGILEISKVAKHFHDSWSGMGASGNGS